MKIIINNKRKANKYGFIIAPKKLKINTIGIIPKKVIVAKVITFIFVRPAT